MRSSRAVEGLSVAGHAWTSGGPQPSEVLSCMAVTRRDATAPVADAARLRRRAPRRGAARGRRPRVAGAGCGRRPRQWSEYIGGAPAVREGAAPRACRMRLYIYRTREPFIYIRAAAGKNANGHAADVGESWRVLALGATPRHARTRPGMAIWHTILYTASFECADNLRDGASLGRAVVLRDCVQWWTLRPTRSRSP